MLMYVGAQTTCLASSTRCFSDAPHCAHLWEVQAPGCHVTDKHHLERPPPGPLQHCCPVQGAHLTVKLANLNSAMCGNQQLVCRPVCLSDQAAADVRAMPRRSAHTCTLFTKVCP